MANNAEVLAAALLQRAFRERGKSRTPVADVKMMSRERMEGIMQAETTTTEDELYEHMMSMGDENDHNPLQELDTSYNPDYYDEEDLKRARQTMDARMNAVAMSSAVTILEWAKWRTDRPGYVDSPQQVIDGINVFVEKLTTHLSEILEVHVQEVKEAAQQNSAQEIATGRPHTEYCFEGCECPPCEQLRTEHRAKFGGEVVQVEAPSLS